MVGIKQNKNPTSVNFENAMMFKSKRANTEGTTGRHDGRKHHRPQLLGEASTAGAQRGAEFQDRKVMSVLQRCEN